MPRYFVAESANDDIDDILAAIIPENEDAAWRWYSGLYEKFDVLAHSPGIGRLRDELRLNLHMFPFGNYLIFYLIVPNGVQIVRVIHGARDVPQVLSQDIGPS
jgi:toxin ParE1/3/4